MYNQIATDDSTQPGAGKGGSPSSSAAWRWGTAPLPRLESLLSSLALVAQHLNSSICG